MSEEHVTPSLGQIRAVYALATGDGRWAKERSAAFDRAMAEHDAELLTFSASETEWAARVTPLDTDYGDPRYYQYPDRLSVERFIKNPPLWYDKRPGETMAVVARRKAGPWMELEE